MRRRWIQLFIIIVLVIALDQLTKSIVVNTMLMGETRRIIPFLSPVFQITRSQNTGAAFGILPQGGDLFLVIAFLVVVGMIYFYPRIAPEAWITRIATGMICGGALGNAIDRLTYGNVVDFIHYQVPGVISNVSNLADHAIVFGVILIFVESWRSDRQQAAIEKEKEKPKVED